MFNTLDYHCSQPDESQLLPDYYMIIRTVLLQNTRVSLANSRELAIRRNENNKPLIIKMPGAREKIIVYITHFLVVERSYSDIHLCFFIK